MSQSMLEADQLQRTPDFSEKYWKPQREQGPNTIVASSGYANVPGPLVGATSSTKITKYKFPRLAKNCYTTLKSEGTNGSRNIEYMIIQCQFSARNNNFSLFELNKNPVPRKTIAKPSRKILGAGELAKLTKAFKNDGSSCQIYI